MGDFIPSGAGNIQSTERGKVRKRAESLREGLRGSPKEGGWVAVERESREGWREGGREEGEGRRERAEGG